ncbi:helix-turn-helix domain-containing protein [Actinacidiphila sp. ITFR-21]|uniref:helix-turn-helix domain-containing protein n=1 Tax=Actinacidiphila sp. ITFR-21 TaxID=3075199 RepID=UPI00288A2546|nr:helix-turn-helix domain-containing protein [Streptomyces sp. ITFR-21]WNI19843.1 helix-turn-helix domain-containing protein [Streptomyces sp. ITFR-21]
MLGAIGLDDVQKSAYRVLVGLGAAEVGDLSHRLGLPEDDTGRVLRRLEDHGLVARSSARPGRWVAAPPGAALSALLTRQRHGLEQAALAAEFRAEATEPAVHDLIEVVTGAGAVAQRFLRLWFGAQREVCALVTDRPVAVTAAENEAEEDGAGRGVAYRVVVERDVVTAAGGLTELAAALGRNEQVRVVDRVPTKLVVADRSTALVPLTRRLAEPAALVVHASGLLESLMGLFEQVWRQAMPLRLEGVGRLVEEAPGQPDGTDLQILSLLLAGLTDASVAKQLDLGLRTVQRRVRRLMEIAGVTTRLQLGWQAYERGWVSRVRA